MGETCRPRLTKGVEGWDASKAKDDFLLVWLREQKRLATIRGDISRCRSGRTVLFPMGNLRWLPRICTL